MPKVKPREGGPYSLFCYGCDKWVPNTANHEMIKEGCYAHSHSCSRDNGEIPASFGGHQPVNAIDTSPPSVSSSVVQSCGKCSSEYHQEIVVELRRYHTSDRVTIIKSFPDFCPFCGRDLRNT